jgi:hypothetical protein
MTLLHFDSKRNHAVPIVALPPERTQASRPRGLPPAASTQNASFVDLVLNEEKGGEDE